LFVSAGQVGHRSPSIVMQCHPSGWDDRSVGSATCRRLTGIQLWVNLARRLPNPYDGAPLFLAAWSTWRDGNGALAGIAAELALESDPGYSAADLLLAALARGLDPHTLPKLRLPAQSKGAAESDINA